MDVWINCNKKYEKKPTNTQLQNVVQHQFDMFANKKLQTTANNGDGTVDRC